MRLHLSAALLLAAALALAGCYEIEEAYTLNPDGSGKVEVTLTLPADQLPPGTPSEAARAVLASLPTDAEGVDAWADLASEVLDDGRVRIKGTAYFRDLELLDLAVGPVPPVRVTPEDARRILWMLGRPIPTPPVEEGLADEVVAERVAALKQRWAQQGPRLRPLLEPLRVRRRARAAGRVAEAANCRDLGDGTVEVEFTGAQFCEALGKIFSDEARLREMAVRGIDFGGRVPGMVVDWIAADVLGAAGPVRAVYAGEPAPVFDYAKEMAAAREAMPETFERAGIAWALPKAPLAGEGFESVQVVGVEWTKYPNTDRPGVRWSQNNQLSVTLLGILPGKVLSVEDCSVRKIEGADGRDLTRMGFSAWPDLSEDGSRVTIRLSTSYVPPIEGFREISGTLVYESSPGVEDTDLGFEALKLGAFGDVGAATIVELGPDEQEGRQVLAIRVGIPHAEIESGRVEDAEGGTIAKLGRNDLDWDGDACTLVFRSADPWPEDARVIVRRHKDVRLYTIPFRVTDVSLLPPKSAEPAEGDDDGEAPGTRPE